MVHYQEGSAYTDYIPMTVRYFDDQLYIISIRESLATTFPVGSKIIEINGWPTDTYMKKYVEPYIESGFSPTVRLLSASALLSAKLVNDTLSIKYQTPENKILVSRLPRDGRSRNNEPSVGYQYKYWDNPIEISWVENDIAILSFNTFNDRNGSLISLFEQLKDTLYNAKGIIIDIRQNRGGSTGVLGIYYNI